MMRAVGLFIALTLSVAVALCSTDGNSFPNVSSEGVRVDRKAVPGGAQLITLFVPAPFDLASTYPEGIPVISYLKDTLGDAIPENDRIRQVWVLTAGKQSNIRRAVNALPFVAFGHDNGTVSGMPYAAVDLGNPAQGTWSSVIRVLIQGQVIDPTGMALRTSSRAYEWNSEKRDDLNVYEANAVLTRLDSSDLPEDVSADVRAMHARLLLSRRILGGLVRDRRLNHVYESDETNRQLARAHNWELVRQQAEANGLYFEPISFGDPQPTHALVWARRSDIAQAARPYNPGLLKIASPWGDDRLIDWKGYSETWRFDANGTPTDGDSGQPDQVIPLALYSLDYPRVPLLIIDFRSSGAAHRRENAARVAQNVTKGLLGFSPVANWNFFVAKWAWDFVARRHGAANDRPARLRYFAETSYLLAMDTSVRGQLRAELKRRMDGASPLMSRRAHIATGQFSMLARVDDSGGISAVLNRDRAGELTSYAHGPFARFGLSLARVGTFGIYRHTEDEDAPLATVDVNRRIAYHTRVLAAALEKNVPLGTEWDTPAIRASITELMDMSGHAQNRQALARLVERVMRRSQNEELRAACARTIQTLQPAHPADIIASGSGKPDCVACRGSVAAASSVMSAGAAH